MSHPSHQRINVDLTRPLLRTTWRYYALIVITAATVAAMVLLYALLVKVVPIISMWELKAGDHQPPKLIPTVGDERPLAELHR